MKSKLLGDKKVKINVAYDYTYEQWFSEMSSFEYTLFAEYIELYETNPEAFLALLANKKEQKILFERLSKMMKVKKMANGDKKEKVEQFFQQVPIMQMLIDLMIAPCAFDYIVEKNVAEYTLGVKDGETFTPFHEEALRDGKLHVMMEDEEHAISVQALIFLLFVNEFLHQKDKERVVRCKTPYTEAIYALSYACALHEDDLSGFLINPTGTFVTSALIIATAFSKTMRFLNDVMELEEYKDDAVYAQEINEQFSMIVSRKQYLLGKCYAAFLQSKVNKLEAREKQSVKKQQELQTKLDKQKQKLDLQIEKTQQLKGELQERAELADTEKLKQQHAAQLATMEKELNSKITDIQKQLKTAKDELKDAKKAHTKELQALEAKLDAQIVDNQQLTTNVSAVQKQLNEERGKRLQMEELTFDGWLQKGREFIQHLSLEEEAKLKGFIELAQNLMQEHTLARPKDDLATNRIGYCRVDAEGHFVNLGDDEWQVLANIPAPIYLSDNQFVEVTKEFEFVQAFNYYFRSGPADHAMTQFVVVEERHGQAFAKVNGKTTEISYRDNAFIKNGQIISVNRANELVTYYQHRSITLDDWCTSIQLKGHTPFYVTNALTNGYVVRTLAEEERFVQLETQLPAHSFIIMNETGEVTYKDVSGRMLKCSSYYTKKQRASVSEVEEQIYVLKENQEYVLLQDVPQSAVLELGDMVWVDEYNRYIELVVEEEQFVLTDTIEQKLRDGGRKVTRKADKAKVEKTKDLLVISNIRISERYKSYFGELGYNVEVVDGTGPFEKIRQACSKHTNIIYSTACTSHKNSGKMSKEVAKPYILCDSTAPKVMHYKLEGIS